MNEIQVIGFIPPMVGLDGEFNTFRLGQTLAKRLAAGDEVFLMNEKTKRVFFGKAVVTGLETGLLGELCLLHAHKNHTEIGVDWPEKAPERLFKYIVKLFGPHIATPDKKSVVISMRRLE